MTDVVWLRQRLGPVRFRNLMRRNASLRRLVSSQVQTTPEALQRTFEILFGERRQVRLITSPTLEDARKALARLEANESFSTLATELSTDFSSARGGLLEPISRVDPGYAESLRLVIWDLPLEGVSSPILLDNQYALVKLVRICLLAPVVFVTGFVWAQVRARRDPNVSRASLRGPIGRNRLM